MDIKNIYNSIITKGRSLFVPQGEMFNPERDWKIIFITFLILFVGFLAFDGYIFWHSNDQDTIDEGVHVSALNAIIDTKKLDDTITLFENKQKQFDYIQANGIPIVDPSR